LNSARPNDVTGSRRLDLRSRLGTVINKLLEPFDLGLTSAEVRATHGSLLETARRYSTLVTEVEAFFRETVFPDLPSRTGRAELLAVHDGTTVIEAMYLLDYLHKALPFNGDVCEFGVARGASSVVIANDILDTNKTLWLFDSFEGLPAPTEKDVLIDDIAGLNSMAAYEGEMAYSVDLVEDKLRSIGFPAGRSRIIEGFVPDIFERTDLPANVCFAYVDFDFYEPILAALRFLDSRLSPGGYIMVDDYGFFSSGAKSAVDEFIEEQGQIYDFILPPAAAGKFCVMCKVSP
jgi:O-methyltransferase